MSRTKIFHLDPTSSSLYWPFSSHVAFFHDIEFFCELVLFLSIHRFNYSFSRLCSIDGTPMEDEVFKEDPSSTVNFFELVDFLPLKKGLDKALFKLFPISKKELDTFMFFAQLSSQEESAATRALFDFKIWELLAVILSSAELWNVSRNVVAWFLLAILYINDENDASPGLRILIRRLVSLPAEHFSKKEIMLELICSPAAPAHFSSLLRIRILEGTGMEWSLPIANSPSDVPCLMAMTHKVTHMMCPSEDGLGSPFISLLSYFVKKFTINDGVFPTFKMADIMLDELTLSNIIQGRRRVRLE